MNFINLLKVSAHCIKRNLVLDFEHRIVESWVIRGTSRKKHGYRVWCQCGYKEPKGASL